MKNKPFVWVAGLLLALVILLRGPGGIAAQTPDLFINELLVGNATTNLDTDYYEYSSWIEIYNGRATPVNLQGYSLSYVDDGAAPLVWKVPGSLTVPAGGTTLLWADEQGKGAHASFTLDMRGDTITLLDPSGAVVDAVDYDMRDGSTLLPDISYGRATDGGSAWVYFDQPTPAGSNTSPGFPDSAIADPPEFSPPGGFWETGQTVTLSTSESSGVIRYTKDGSTPTAASREYDGPITVSETMVVRARVFTPDKLDSQTGTHTYLINVSRNLPVVSLATNPDHLFDDMIGIYVVGTNGRVASCSGTEPANFNQPWERPVSMEMVETDGRRVVAQDMGFEISGAVSRCINRKSLELKARRTYGDNDIDYAILPDKPIDSYKRLVLRNSGGDAYATLFKDALQQNLVRDMMDIDAQGYRPVVVYINGAYWGIHNLRDKADEAFVEQTYGLDADADFDMIKDGRIIEAGNNSAWKALQTFVANNDLRVPANYDYVASQVDMDEFMNYFIVQIYGNNTDWPAHNIRYWRAYENGRWRWVLYDLDHGFDVEKVTRAYLTYVLTCTSCKDKAQAELLLLRKLMQNTEFKQAFSQRFASHIAITYAPERVNDMIDWFKAGIEAEMPAHMARWGQPRSAAIWESKIMNLRQFAEGRPAPMLNDLNANLGQPGTAVLTLNMVGTGDVLVAGVQVPGSGFQGDYFKSVPLTLEAVGRPGKQFVRWEETGETDATITVTMNGAMTRTAVFEDVAIPKVVINEIHYNPADAQGIDDDYEFLELVNAGTARVNLAGFQVTDGISFTFPAGAKIEAGEIIVLAKNGSTYAGQGYQVFTWDFDGSLSNGGERIALLDGSGGLVDEVTYDDAAPWPLTPDGSGPSLALIDPALDNSLAASWAASPSDNGSPGAANPSGPPQPASLTIVKEVVGAAPGADWSFSGDLGAFTMPAAGGQQIFSGLTPGSFTVTETAVSGYMAEVSCTNGASGTAAVTVALGSGADVTCTFVNTEVLPAALTIVKEVVGAVPGADWSFGGDLGAFTLPAAGGQQTFSGLTPGNFTVTETAVSGYGTAVSCTNGASGTTSVTVALGSGADVTCTFVNTEVVPAKLTIVKEVVGAAPGADWSFSGDLGAFTLPAVGGQQTFSGLAPGSFTVTETAVSGYTAEVSCTNGASGTSAVTVALGSGADVTCTFVNTEDTSGIPPQGHCSPPVPGNVIQNPGFESDRANWLFHTDKNATFSVVSQPAAGVVPYECSSNARVAIGTPGTNVQLYQRSIPLKPDTTYTLRLAARSSGGEDIQVYLQRDSAPYTNYGLNTRTAFDLTPAWQVFVVEFRTRGFTSATTDTRLRLWLAPFDQAGTVYEFDDIVLTEGTAAPPQPASLTIVKQVVGDAPGADWAFSGTGGVGAFTLPAAGGQQTFNGLTPGDFTVTETAVAGYAAEVSCTNGASGTDRVTVALGSGANVTCTFVNTAVPPASLTIVKQVVGAIPAADWSFSGDLGAFTLPAAGGQQTFTALPAGGYEVTETAVSGYRTAVSCTNGASGASGVTVALAGVNVTCTFVNTEDTSGFPPQGHCSPPVPGNVIQNPGFESARANWLFYTDKTASFSVVSQPAAGVVPYECSSNARVAIGTPGTNVQLYQRGFPLKPNTTYTLRLAARSSGGEDIQLYLQRDSAPYTNYGLNTSTALDLTAEWQVFQVEFTTRGFTCATTDTRLRIWLAPFDKSGTVYEFDDIVLTEK